MPRSRPAVSALRIQAIGPRAWAESMGRELTGQEKCGQFGALRPSTRHGPQGPDKIPQNAAPDWSNNDRSNSQTSFEASRQRGAAQRRVARLQNWIIVRLVHHNSTSGWLCPWATLFQPTQPTHANVWPLRRGRVPAERPTPVQPRLAGLESAPLYFGLDEMTMFNEHLESHDHSHGTARR